MLEACIHAVIPEFAIAPEYQGKHFGKALMTHVLTYAERESLNIAVLPAPCKL